MVKIIEAVVALEFAYKKGRSTRIRAADGLSAQASNI